jgi:hypothetical protein
MDVLEEQVQVILGPWAQGPFTFEGQHYSLRELEAQPKPVQRPHPPIIFGGVAGPRGAALAARYADEYNTAFPTLADVRERRAAVERACEDAGGAPPDDAAEQLAALREAGVHRVMCQHLLHDDLDAVALIGRELPALLA